MWTLQGFLDYFFLESEEEDKTGSITALLYTEETVQDELFSSCSKPAHQQTSKTELCNVGQNTYFCQESTALL